MRERKKRSTSNTGGGVRNGFPERETEIRKMAADGMAPIEIAKFLFPDRTIHTRKDPRCREYEMLVKFLRYWGIATKKTPPPSLPGSMNPAWHGGHSYMKGYKRTWVGKNHPHARNGYVLEHRLVMESMLGRYLEPDEVVHHKDGNIQNNDPSNLELFDKNGDHLRKSLTGKCPKWTVGGRERILRAISKPRSPEQKERMKSPKSPEHREAMKKAWTPDRKKQWAERMAQAWASDGRRLEAMLQGKVRKGTSNRCLSEPNDPLSLSVLPPHAAMPPAIPDQSSQAMPAQSQTE